MSSAVQVSFETRSAIQSSSFFDFAHGHFSS